MRRFIEIKITNNSKVYKRLRKQELEKNGEIYCCRCPYHNGENYDKKYDKKYYGTVRIFRKTIHNLNEDIRYPSWKLTSKNRKQWMDKKINIHDVEYFLNGKAYTYRRIKW